ncbi:MAG: sirohydrochlorin cobaltochelatase [Hydrogenoanaerobacterium sp.]
MGKKALVAVSFGTTHEDALKAISQTEVRLQDEKPDYAFFRAFTSRMVIERLRKKGVFVPSATEVFEKLLSQGFTEVICQPTHIISGAEYEKLRDEAQKISPKFISLRLGAPLLSQESDYARCCKIITEAMPPLLQDEALVLMGHGTGHFANAAYCQLENTFRAQGHERVYVGTVEGFPTIKYVLDRLKKHDIKAVRLRPFMLVAGEHAVKDLAGENDSWNTVLLREGFKTYITLKGLGEEPAIQELFVQHLNAAIKL